jgi:hypothetical protein
MSADRCGAMTKSGAPCSALHWRDGFCRWHHPDNAGKAQENGRKGGRNRSATVRAKKALPAEPLSVAEVHSWLGLVFRGVMSGKIDPPVGTACATIARTMADLSRSVAQEGELAELRQMVNEIQQDRTSA